MSGVRISLPRPVAKVDHCARSSTGQSTGLLSRRLQVRLLQGAPVMDWQAQQAGGIMVGVAQLVEPWIVIPVVVGSSPIVHPTLLVEIYR